jgi:DNA primase catalytic core
MAKIPEEELARLKDTVDLPTLIRAKGVELKPHGAADLIGRCPFHADKTPSLVVTPKKGLWHCLGACQKGGDVVSWVMQAEGVSFRHAVELLREGKASALLASDKVVKTATIPKLPPPLAFDADEQTLLNQVADFYHKTLLEDLTAEKAREYLKRRRLDNPEAIATFRLGYANRTLGLRLPDKNREAGAAIRARLEALGVFRRESGHEHLTGSLIVPILDEAGNVHGLYGRKVLDNLRPGTAYHLYLPGPHRGFFNPAALQQKDVILCEALLDALSFWAHGFKNVTASYGVEGFTEEMLSAFLSRGVRRVYLAYDRDEAGDRAAEKLSKKLLSEGIECLRLLFPHGMDANEYVRKMDPPGEALKTLLHGAQWLGKRSVAVPAAPVLPLPSGERVDLETGEVLEDAADENTPSLVADPLAASLATVEASALPPMPSAPEPPLLPYTVQGEDVHIPLGDRTYRVRGLYKNTSFEVLRVNLRVSIGERYHLDQLDFYSAKGREGFVSHAAAEVNVKPDIVKRDLGRILLLLERLQEERINATLKPKDAPSYTLTLEEKKDALAYLAAPDLAARIVADLSACGYVGEDMNKLVGYLAATSRKLDDPLSVLIQSSSASGKSSLMDAVLALIPTEEKAQYSALTGQALFYMEGKNLKHKVLSIAEDGGLQKAAYALKSLITDKRLSIAAPGKDPETGKLITQTYEVEGPTAVFYTTTAAEVEIELKNRCVVLTLNEDKAQTEAILKLQRHAQTLEGKKEKSRRERIRLLHHNAQRLLRPLTVVNPYAAHLRFSSSQSRLRRDQMKYLTLMNALALLHQYQRPLKRDVDAGEYVEVELSDVALANRLCAEILGRTLDELAPQTRRLLELLRTQVTAIAKEKALEWPQIRLSRFDIRQHTAWSDTALKVHLRRLSELEYLAVHRKGALGFEYELLYRGEGEDGGRFMLGLIDVEELQRNMHGYAYDAIRSGLVEHRSGQNGLRSGVSPGLVSPRSGGGPGEAASLSPNDNRALRKESPQISENAYREAHPSPSHLNHKEASSSLAAVVAAP